MSMKQPQGNPFFFMPMMGPTPEYGRPESIPDIVVPARINKAMEFLELMAMKTQTRAAVSENQIQQIEGQKLTVEEMTAQATACNLLNQYFAGQLPVDKWEEVRLTALQQKVENRKKTNRPMKILRCMACGGSDKNCPLCEGTGTLIVVNTKQDAEIIGEIDAAAKKPKKKP